MLRFRCDHVANTLPVTTNRDRASPLLAGSPTEQRLTALHSRSPPQRTYGLLQTRPRGSFAAQPAALKPPGQFRAAPLPHRCRVPSVRAPGQDFHLRSQHPYPAHQGRRCAARCARPCRATLDRTASRFACWQREVAHERNRGGSSPRTPGYPKCPDQTTHPGRGGEHAPEGVSRPINPPTSSTRYTTSTDLTAGGHGHAVGATIATVGGCRKIVTPGRLFVTALQGRPEAGSGVPRTADLRPLR